MELATKMRTHADKLGVEFVTAKVTEAELTGSVKKVRTDREVYEAGHVIIATGARHASLGVKGEELFTGKGSLTVRPATVLFSKIKMWQLSAEETSRQRMHCTLRVFAKKYF